MIFCRSGLATVVFMFIMYFSLSETKKQVDAAVPDPVPVFIGKPVHWPTMLRRVWPAAATCFCHGWVLWFFLNWIPSFFTHNNWAAAFSASIVVVILGSVLAMFIKLVEEPHPEVVEAEPVRRAVTHS